MVDVKTAASGDRHRAPRSTAAKPARATESARSKAATLLASIIDALLQFVPSRIHRIELFPETAMDSVAPFGSIPGTGMPDGTTSLIVVPPASCAAAFCIAERV
jgi:hypothetical protein